MILQIWSIVKLWENDIVDFLGHKGKIRYECGRDNSVNTVEVISNIFDNPELMKEGAE